MRRSPGKAALISSRRRSAWSATAARVTSGRVRGAQSEAMNSRNAWESGRWERFEPRSARSCWESCGVVGESSAEATISSSSQTRDRLMNRTGPIPWGIVRIDLHTHSSVSDGTDSPTELIAAARRAGLDVVALTDHDSTAGWEEAAEAARAEGIALVRGTEISCKAGGVSVHLLSYLHDPQEPQLARVLAASRESRLGRAREMVRRLAPETGLTWEEVSAQAQEGATIGRPDIADALVARGVVADRGAAFETLLSASGPYYVRYRAPEAAEAVRLVRRAGGVPVLAHPRAATRGRVVAGEAVRGMASAGLAGLESAHRDHTKQDRRHLHHLADELDLLTTGSSDYHGAGKPNQL